MTTTHIGFVSTRFCGPDGVSLESSKWAQVLEQHGFRCFWFAGMLDRDAAVSDLVPEAHFEHAQNAWINTQIFGTRKRDLSITDHIHTMRVQLKTSLYRFVERFELDLLVVENALTLPMHIPLGMALTELISETRIPAIAHHHDFYWERDRYAVNAVNDYLQMAFPPTIPGIAHVVINTAAQTDLARRRGISAHVIPNVLDFDHPPKIDYLRSQQFKNSLGLLPDDIMVLQPTRIIRRKGIEMTLDLLAAMQDERCRLVLSHIGADEGYDYRDWVKARADRIGVDLRIVEQDIASPWAHRNGNAGKFTLWHIYPHADLVTLPSLQEGFGNALLEAIYFKRPIMINRYPTFVRDIEPNGFDLICIDSFVSAEDVGRVKALLGSPDRVTRMCEHNYDVARNHYSYRVLEKHLVPLVKQMLKRTGPSDPAKDHSDPHDRNTASSTVDQMAVQHATG